MILFSCNYVLKNICYHYRFTEFRKWILALSLDSSFDKFPVYNRLKDFR